MRLSILRAVLAALAIGSSVLFVFATRAERRREHAERQTQVAARTSALPVEPTTAVGASSIAPTPRPVPTTASRSGTDPDGGEHPAAAAPTTSSVAPSPGSGTGNTVTTSLQEPAGAAQHGSPPGAEKVETLLGVKTESAATTAAVVVASVAAAGSLLARRRWLWAIAAFGIVLAVLDGHEAIHQANLSRGRLETLALILAAAHVAAAVVATLVASGRPVRRAGDR